MDIHEIWGRVKDILAPRLCVVCGNRLDFAEHSVCSHCLHELPYTCYHQNPYENPVARLFWKRMNIEKATSLFFFYPKAEYAQIIYDLKYHFQPDIGYDMGRFAAECMERHHFFDDIDAIIPVPLTKERIRERGYNQSEFIAEGISSVTGLPVWPACVERITFNESQTLLHREKRFDNVEHAFRIKDEFSVALHHYFSDNDSCNLHILLVDDVITTGATMISLASAVSHIGNCKFSVFSLGFTRE